MAEAAAAKPRKTLSAKTIGLMLVPLILLAGVIALFLATNGAGLQVQPAAPVESLTFDKTILRPGEIELNIRNTSPQPITISAININDGIWPFTAAPSANLGRFGQAKIVVNYAWVRGESYAITLFTSSSIAFSTSIPVAAATAAPNASTDSARTSRGD